MIHRSGSRPFRLNPLAGEDRLRIYLLTTQSYYVTPGESDDVLAELRTRKVTSLARAIGSVWILLVSLLIAWLSAKLRNPEVGWAVFGVGCLGTLTFGGILALDFLQVLRLPQVVLAVYNDGRLHFFDDKLKISKYQSLGIRTRSRKSNHRLPTASRTYTVDLISIEQGRQHEYQLMASLGSELGPLARRLSTATGIPLESDIIKVISIQDDSGEDSGEIEIQP